MIRRLAIALAFLFIVPAILLTALPSNVAGQSCGVWVAPKYTDLEVATQRARQALGQPVAAPPRLMQAACEDRLNDRRTLVLVLVFLGIAAPVLVAFVGAAARRQDVPAA